MKAAFLEGVGKIAVKEWPKPKAKPGTAVVKVTYCAICGSELRRFKEVTSRGSVGGIGHEFVGEIEEVGSELKGWKVGDRVTVDPFYYCHKCYWCLHGQENACPNRVGMGGADRVGAYAEYVEVMPEQLFHTPAQLSDKEATMIQCLAVALHATKKADIKISDKVAVIGAGPMGLMAMQIARLLGAAKVFIFAKGEGRKRVAAKLGADVVFDAKDSSETKRVKDITNGLGADSVIEASGGTDTFVHGVLMTRGGGIVVLVGGFKGNKDFAGLGREIIVKGSSSYTHEEFGEAIDLVASKRVNVLDMITGIETLDNIQKAFEGLRDLTDQVKVIIAPTGKV